MGLRPARPSVAKGQASGSGGPSHSTQGAQAKSYLYGGTSAIVGILGLVVGGALYLVGNPLSGGIVIGLGAVLIVAGFVVSRYGK